MRKICLINYDPNTKTSLNIFSQLARRGKRVLIVDLRENKTNNNTGDPDVYTLLNEGRNIRRYIKVLERNLEVINGAKNVNYHEFNLFYDLFKFDFFDKRLENLESSYDYVVLEVSPSLNLFTINSMFYSNEVMSIVEGNSSGVDFLNKLARFIYHFNQFYGKKSFISHVIPEFKEEVSNELYTMLISEFTTNLITFPLVRRRDENFVKAIKEISRIINQSERIFDSKSINKQRQKKIEEYLDIIIGKGRE